MIDIMAHSDASLSDWETVPQTLATTPRSHTSPGQMFWVFTYKPDPFLE